MSPSRFSLRLLGTASLEGSDAAAALPAQPKRFALLAWLAAAQPEGWQRRDRALALFWPDHEPTAARNALRQSLHALRGALDDDAIVTRGDEEIGIDRNVISCDVSAFHEALSAGRLARALELYRGDLLEGLHVRAAGFERWLESERARLLELAAHAAWQLAERYEHGNDLTSASRWARKAARLARGDERRIRRVIRLLDRAGDRAGAAAVYEEFARFLRAELDMEPSEETRALIESVRAGAGPGRAPG
jgi:DNA-binding SARP family transcriptional activator